MGGGGGVAIEGSGTVTGNKFAFNRGGALGVSPGVGVDHDIIVRNAGFGIYCQGQHDAETIACNDVWANDGGNYAGSCPDLTGSFDNISLDPLFCDDGPPRDFRLRTQSPCTEENSLCGQMGALGTACGVAGISGSPPGAMALLLQPAPTPAAGEVTIAFEVFDAAAAESRPLADRWFEPGRHEIVWSAWDSHAPRPGVYLAVLQTREGRQSRRLIMVR